MTTETYWVTEFGIEYWSLGYRWGTEQGAKDSLGATLRMAQRIDENNAVRIVKVTREIIG